MHLEFVEPSKRWADILIPEGGNNEVALDLVITKLLSLIAAQPVWAEEPAAIFINGADRFSVGHCRPDQSVNVFDRLNLRLDEISRLHMHSPN